MNAPIVSVIVPCHNAEAFLQDALVSVRDQSLRLFECIMVDDASADSSRDIARNFTQDDPRFSLIAFDRNQGVSACRNAAIRQAKGSWVALLDADDLYRFDRLERLVAIGEREAADMVFDDLIVTEFPASKSRYRAFGYAERQTLFTQDDFFTGNRLFRRSFPTGYMQPLFRREFLERTEAVYDPSVASGEDFLFYSRLFAERPRCIAVNYAGYVYRRRRGSLSRSDRYVHVHSGLGTRVLQEFGSVLSPVSRTAIARRARDVADIENALPALIALRERRAFQVLARIVERPGVAWTFLRLARTRLSRWLDAMFRPERSDPRG